ncbi:MAG: bifunctional 4-hydroxy-2-oxoglutarate aldolase/2-dehydro-3-deoxy-phosphogluconate aldolase [Candidatus Omnitrophica bacterium]|nr:bifunctional 4-hydroxy-2-oxoglutarate aldolase/2-dehydro-3-deoxy-phosphogluconate aldolase [Candidatus Omnitrophota bacterium]
MNLNNFTRLPILGIARGIVPEDLEPLVLTVIDAGLEAFEITMNTKGAAELIKRAKNIAGGKLAIGAGTVLTKKDLEAAVSAGASFIVMPVIIEDVIKKCVKENIPVFPGALTPNEVLRAWELGATMVKVFPANAFGPKYIKELKGPLNRVKLMAVAGVTKDNIPDYFASGADAVAFGGSIFGRELFDKKDFGTIGREVRAMVDKVRKIAGESKG